MPRNIFEKKNEKPIFNDESVLYPEFVPERLPHRDNEIDLLAGAFQPVLKGMKPGNAFIFGSPGTGKTVTVRFVLKELENYSDRAKGLVINCWQLNSRTAILSEIINFLGRAVPRRGLGADELYSYLKSTLKGISFSPIIILDEADKLFEKGEASQLIYDLARLEVPKNFLSLVMIANNESLALKLDPRIDSSLMPLKLEFKQYNPSQLKDILKERCKFAFTENAADSEIINLASAFAAKNNGDARIAIQSLLNAGRLAEKQGKNKITVDLLKQSFVLSQDNILKKKIMYLKPELKKLLLLVSDNPDLKSMELFALFKSKHENKCSPRNYRYYLKELLEKELVNSNKVKHGNGLTRSFKINFPEKFLELLE